MELFPFQVSFIKVRCLKLRYFDIFKTAFDFKYILYLVESQFLLLLLSSSMDSAKLYFPF